MAERRRLQDILRSSDRERLAEVWDSTRAADDLKPIPPGDYRCRVVDGALCTSKSDTPGYKLTMEILDGAHAGRRLWHDVWLSPAALPMAKRDLGKLGIESLQQLENPLPEHFIIRAKVALRKGDDGTEFNRIVRFEVVDFERPEPDPFAPIDGADADGFDWRTGNQGGATTP
jgi:hypothetical protein